MKYRKGDKVRMRVPDKEILESPIYTNSMIKIFKINPMVKIVGIVDRVFGLAYYVDDWKGNNRTIREEWIADSRGPVLFI